MKKYLLLLFLITSSISFSQNNQNDCSFDYKIELKGKEANDNLSNPKEASVTFNWDFSALNFDSEKVTIEIIPILDCFNQAKASLFTASIFIKNSDTEFDKKGQKTFKHLELKAKCFKYRIIISNLSCKETSDWKYYSYF